MRIMTTRWNREPHRASRPFSRDRDGFVLAEGAWFFVLEEMEHARARGAHIYGEIAGYASTCEAYHRVRLEECGEEPARTMQMAMEEAGIAPRSRQVHQLSRHIHRIERQDRNARREARVQRTCVQAGGLSLKSLIGHPQGACGAAGVAATLLAMRDGFVPPTINLDEPDPECDLDYIPGHRPRDGYRVCRRKLHCVRQQEFRAGVTENVTKTRRQAGDAHGFEDAMTFAFRTASGASPLPVRGPDMSRSLKIGLPSPPSD